MLESLFSKVAGLRPVTLFKKRLLRRCFTVNFVKFSRASFFIEHLQELLSNLYLEKTLYGLFQLKREIIFTLA